MNRIRLSEEQELFVSKALAGNNILVDACIGSGKTTAIQYLCTQLPKEKKILYLTYNRLLKLDAQAKIKRKNAKVQNYNGIAASYLFRMGISVGISDQITRFNEMKPDIDKYDILIIDEYQDIETEHSILLEHIKSSNPGIQIIAVGDMQQKIYDKTNLNISEFIHSFLDDYLTLEFTICFRLSAGIAERLGRIWNKQIKGVNDDCLVEEMNMEQIVTFISSQNPRDILCLGARTGDMSKVLNKLESDYPSVFNKQTVYASIAENDSLGATQPNESTAIFTTFDSSKGMERPVCVVFDYTEDYWQSRISKPNHSYEILRNIFCVAASRGKSRIIFVNSGKAMLSEATLSTRVDENKNYANVDISSMFDYKYKEDIKACFSLLNVEQIEVEDGSLIEVKRTDGMIDLSPCIGIYQEAMFFDDYEIEKAIELFIMLHDSKKTLWNDKIKGASLEEKILFLVSLETTQDRYRTQVELPFIDEKSKEQISERLFSRLQHDENAQVGCSIPFSDKSDGPCLFIATGFADVVKDDVVYELKFVSELTSEHFLQCACYIVALNLEKGILWNTRDNTVYKVTVQDKIEFLNAVANAITKNKITEYYKPISLVPRTILQQPAAKMLTAASTLTGEFSKYITGAKVKHKEYGIGKIIKNEILGWKHIIVVSFGKKGTRRLALDMAIKNKIIRLVSDEAEE